MIGYHEIQFAGMVLTLILEFLLFSIRIPETPDTKPYRVSRMFMMLSVAILFFHFLIQRTLDLRAEENTSAILVNLVFFFPATGAFQLGYLYMQRQGRMKGWELAFWPVTYIICTLALTIAVIADKGNFGGKALQIVENCEAGVLLLSMVIFDCLSVRESFLMRRSLNNYYDYPADKTIRWTFMATMALFFTAIPIPFVTILGLRTWTFFVGSIFLLFYSYTIIHFALFYFEQKTIAAALVRKDTEPATPEVRRRVCRFSDEDIAKITDALKGWVDRKCYVTPGLTIDDLAKDIDVSRTMISAYLNEAIGKTFRDWLTDLRIEEACRQLTAHPDYSNAYIAEACGFSSRQYFQNVFHAKTGKTPLGWIKENVKKQ